MVTYLASGSNHAFSPFLLSSKIPWPICLPASFRCIVSPAIAPVEADHWKGAPIAHQLGSSPFIINPLHRLWAMSKLKLHIINLSKALQPGLLCGLGKNPLENPAGPCIPLPSQLQPTRTPKKRTAGTVPVPAWSQPNHLLLLFIKNSQPEAVLPRLKMSSAPLKPETESRAFLMVFLCQGPASPPVLDDFHVNWNLNYEICRGDMSICAPGRSHLLL